MTTKDWRQLKLREKTKMLLEKISETTHSDFVESIILFGSEARGAANLTSDVDIALVSSRQLDMKERLSILSNVPQDLYNDVDVRIVCLRKGALETTNRLDVGYSIKREGVVIYENIS
ncbi:MAG: nucleotidyltransferase domain-containing protein [Defluviitaleaceae bacterium]|nr:nucleotidyltransferase domain-containing protein [Defluviitaleaceae bacterium]MCL2263642.1 nucleotidyltransferase domain-containing protein [Defluviitaleaceae bacterium]